MRKTTYFFMVFVLLVSASMVVADTGLINVKSHFNVEKTAERFVGAATEAGLKVFNRIDHAAGATEVGKRHRFAINDRPEVKAKVSAALDKLAKQATSP
ncbi:MAG: hypothetical protein PVI97_03845 [Candidatus Thiodiazotropha sp.]|jgi:uncharacterized protein (DUF302 family)